MYEVGLSNLETFQGGEFLKTFGKTAILIVSDSYPSRRWVWKLKGWQNSHLDGWR